MKTWSRTVARFAVSLSTLGACADSAPTPTPVAPANPARRTTSGGHAAPHGGVVLMNAEPHLHIEILMTQDGVVKVYPADGSMQPVPAAEASGSIKCEVRESHDVGTGELKPAGDGSLVAQCPPLTEKGALLRLTLQVRGVTFERALAVPQSGTAAIHEHEGIIEPTRHLVLPPGGGAEVNFVFRAVSELSGNFKAAAPVSWNIHSHPTSGTVIHMEGVDASHELRFKPSQPGVYSVMWKNKSAAPIALDVELMPVPDVRELRH